MRFRGRTLYLPIVTLVLAVAPALYAQSLEVTRADGTSTALTAAQISGLAHVTINTKDHDTLAQFDGVPLAEILKLAGVDTGKTKGPQMTQALVIEAAGWLQSRVCPCGA